MTTDIEAREADCDAATQTARYVLQGDIADALLRVARNAWERGRQFGMQSQSELDAALFNVRHAADMRAIARWQAEKPGRELRQPDHADLCVWLLERLEEAENALHIAEWGGSPPPIRTKHKTSEELIVMPDPSFMPQDGAVFRHYKGGLYQVLMVVRREGSQEDMVVYQDRDRTMPWVRPLSEFAEKFSYVSNVGWEPS